MAEAGVVGEEFGAEGAFLFCGVGAEKVFVECREGFLYSFSLFVVVSLLSSFFLIFRVNNNLESLSALTILPISPSVSLFPSPYPCALTFQNHQVSNIP